MPRGLVRLIVAICSSLETKNGALNEDEVTERRNVKKKISMKIYALRAC